MQGLMYVAQSLMFIEREYSLQQSHNRLMFMAFVTGHMTGPETALICYNRAIVFALSQLRVPQRQVIPRLVLNKRC